MRDLFVLSKTTPITDEYVIQQQLGQGAFGVVCQCEHKATGAVRAVKKLKKLGITEDALVETAEEIKIVKKLDHPNILKVYEEYEDQKYLYIVSELLEGGELFDELIRRKKFTERD